MNSKIISIDQETMGGTPVFQGTRVPIKSLFDYIDAGEPIKEFLDNFPSVKEKQVFAVLKMAHESFFNEIAQGEGVI